MKRFLLLLSFMLVPAAVLCQQPGEKVRFFKPGFGWAVEAPFGGFEITQAKMIDDNAFKVEAVSDKEGVILTVYFDPGAPDAEPGKVRTYYENILKEALPGYSSLEKWEKGGNAFLIYLAKGAIGGDRNLDELNGNMYRAKGSTWIDVRFRIPDPKEGDAKKIRSFLEKTSFLEAFEPTVADSLFMGNIYCFSNHGTYCLGCLGDAYDKEKKKPALSRELRIALYENYANALRLSGDRGRALEVADHGLSRDSGYPMYYWIKARLYADLGDEDNTVNMLALAVKNFDKLLPGEKLPDPRQDEAFKLLGMKQSFAARVTAIFFPEGYDPEASKKGK